MNLKERAARLKKMCIRDSSCPVRDMQIHTQSLEEIFMHYYGSEV